MNRRHNPQRFSILAIGKDISQLSSGANLLTQAGYNTDLILKIDDAVRRVIIPRYHLVIVSGTFAHDEQISIRARIRQLRPQMPVLLLGPEHDSPQVFLAAVAESLRLHSKPHLVAPGSSRLADTSSTS